MAKAQRLPRSGKAGPKVPVFGVFAPCDPRIDEASRTRARNIVEMAAEVVAKGVRTPDQPSQAFGRGPEALFPVRGQRALSVGDARGPARYGDRVTDDEEEHVEPRLPARLFGATGTAVPRACTTISVGPFRRSSRCSRRPSSSKAARSALAAAARARWPRAEARRA